MEQNDKATTGTGTISGAPAILKGNPNDLLIGVIGLGRQAEVLIESILNREHRDKKEFSEAMRRPYIPNVHIKAVCDIWDDKRDPAVKRSKYDSIRANGYEDYREMLDKEKDIQAVIVASPDWMHADHAIAAMEAGKHVYCEKEMSNSLEKARQMVLAQRRTGRLLQIGHQRRSNPRYIHAIDRLIQETRLLGRVTKAYAQWNRAKSKDIECEPRINIPPEKLKQFGYDTMQQFLNWRWYKKYGGGPIVDLGSHQIDLFSWVFGANPKAVSAGGGVDFYKDHEWYDNVMTIYEYETKDGLARAFYQVLTTTSYGGFHESFMGDQGTLSIAEVPSFGNTVKREAHASSWDEFTKQGLLSPIKTPIKPSSSRNALVDVRVTAETGRYPLPVELTKPAHTPHLQNFFDAIRLGCSLTCPAEVGYETAVAVLAANRAVETGRRIEFRPEEFKV
ncbi:MAG: Gfo/Idh/MocA family oxidoreductase [Candidatus Sumerlaeota bacterium]|nr:Gfo/Idh/MocA family oxidoreductase [Candidatus Sumerlaeota bacterium]